MNQDESFIVQHYDYTYVVRYRYSEEDESRKGYYCNDTYDFYPTEDELKDFFNIEDGDELEILGQIGNDFNNDEILSDDIVSYLKGSPYAIKDKEYADDCLGYIIYASNILHLEEWKAYKVEVMKSVLIHLDLRKQNPMMEYVLDRLFKIFAIERDNTVSLRKQIELIANPKAFNEILLKLAEPQDIKLLRRDLDWMDRLFHISEEKSRYTVGVLFLLFSERCKFLLPSVKFNMTKCFGLLADYYGIEAPTYRQNELRTHEIEVKGGKRRKLYDVMLSRNGDFWRALK